MVDKKIGETIKELRSEKGYTQEELAKKIGYSKAALSKIENGKSSLTLETLEKLAIELGESIDYILGDTLKKEDYQLAAIKSLIDRFVRISTVNEYFYKNNDTVFAPEEFIYSLLAATNTENSLILQMDKNLMDFAKSVAEAENLKRILGKQEYNNRILSAIVKLNKSAQSKEVNSYCLTSVQDIKHIIEAAVKIETSALRALAETTDEETID